MNIDEFGMITLPPERLENLPPCKTGIRFILALDIPNARVILRPTLESDENPMTGRRLYELVKEMERYAPSERQFIRSVNANGRLYLPDPVLRFLRWNERTALQLAEYETGFVLSAAR